MLSVHNKDMYNHIPDLCEHWNAVVDLCNGRDGPHSPSNAVQRHSCLLDMLAWFSRLKELHDETVKEKHSTEYKQNLVPHQVIVAGSDHCNSDLLCVEGPEYQPNQ